MQLGQVLINEYGLDPCTLTHDNISVMSLVVVCHYCNTLISIISRSHGGTEFCCWAGWWLAGCVNFRAHSVAVWSSPRKMLQTVRYSTSSGAGASTVADISELLMSFHMYCCLKCWSYEIQPDPPCLRASWITICAYATRSHVASQSVLSVMNVKKQ